jgi:hypothetical protein
MACSGTALPFYLFFTLTGACVASIGFFPQGFCRFTQSVQTTVLETPRKHPISFTTDYYPVLISTIILSKAVPLHAIEALGGNRKYSSYSFLTSALDGGEWSASRLGRPLPAGKDPPGQEVGWAPEPVWTQRLEETSFWQLYCFSILLRGTGSGQCLCLFRIERCAFDFRS